MQTLDLKVDVSRQLKKLDIGNKWELGIKTRQCKYSLRGFVTQLISVMTTQISSSHSL